MQVACGKHEYEKSYEDYVKKHNELIEQGEIISVGQEDLTKDMIRTAIIGLCENIMRLTLRDGEVSILTIKGKDGQYKSYDIFELAGEISTYYCLNK